MTTYQITMAKRVDIYGGNQAAVDSSPVVIVESTDKTQAFNIAFKAFNDESESVYVACSFKKIASKKKILELLSQGAKDLR